MREPDIRELEEARFEQVLDAHGAALRRVAAAYERDAARREDLFQDICFAIWRALPRFRGEASERTFVLRIAHNRAVAHSTRRRPPALELSEAGPLADPGADPETEMCTKQRHQRLGAALHRLPIATRQILTLALEGLAHREIADVLGTSENNVAVRLSRARDRLRRELRQEGTRTP